MADTADEQRILLQLEGPQGPLHIAGTLEAFKLLIRAIVCDHFWPPGEFALPQDEPRAPLRRVR